VVAGKERYFISDLRDILVGRILQSISDALAGARLSYAEIDAKRDELSADILARLGPEFGKLGFEASDFRIEGTDFDAETKERINRIAGTIADTHAATAAGLSFTEMQRVEAMRDAAKNEGGGAGVGMGLGAGIGMGEYMAGALGGAAAAAKPPAGADASVAGRLRTLDQLLREKLIDEAEYQSKRKEILAGL
jgi:membrane protease subunit (stomatin/prohibitin family)